MHVRCRQDKILPDAEDATAVAEKRSFALPDEQAAFIDRLVQSGAYATGSEVVRDGLRALQQRDAAIKRWLRPKPSRILAQLKNSSAEKEAR